MVWIVLIGLVCLTLWLYFKFFKIPKIKNVIFVDGSLGTGKTFYSVYLAIRLHKRAVRSYKFKRLLSRIPLFSGKFHDLEEPLLFSNIPLQYPHCRLTIDILRRQKRPPFGSVLLIDEVSIVCDQFDYKDRDVSNDLRDFMKLFRHMVHGNSKSGYLVLNSQSTSDLHYSIKSVLSDYLYIHHKTNLPFFALLSVQEMGYSADKDGNSIVNVRNEDIEETMKLMLIPKKYYKYYDTWCYSLLTDGLDVVDDVIYPEKGDSLKTREVLTFKEDRYLPRGGNDE